MTEAEWQGTTDPMPLLGHLRADHTGRRYLLYLTAGCRHIGHQFHDPVSLDAVGVAERFADGQAGGEDLGRANWRAEAPTFGFDFQADFYERYPGQRDQLPRLVAMGALADSAVTGGEWRADEAVVRRLLAAAELAYLATLRPEVIPGHLERVGRYVAAVSDWPGRWLVDCIYGNPFRPVALDPVWRSETVVAIATGVYAERAFDRLPILADALEEAGCEDEQVLTHCRVPGPHVRGCWVVDLVLGKG